jgi:type VI secretion system protein ImpG
MQYYYQEELSYLRKLFARFAKEHPKIAARLRLDERGMTEDPDVAQLMESFAFSNAKLTAQLTDDYSEISHPLLELLSPHFLAPVPATSIVQLQANPELLSKSKYVPKQTLLHIKHPSSQTLYFNTCYPVDVWPIEIVHAKLTAQPFQAPKIPAAYMPSPQEITAVLRVSLRCTNHTTSWADLAPGRLRLFIRADQYKFRLYELLMQHTACIALADSMVDTAPAIISTAPPQRVGFTADEQLLPYADSVKTAQRLLMDYAILPDKFLFFDVTGLQPVLAEKFTNVGQTLELIFYLRAGDPILEKNLNAQSLALNCTPVINLFSATIELPGPDLLQSPIALTAQLQHPDQTEIFSIQKISGSKQQQTTQEFPNYHRVHYQAGQIYYHAKRVPAWQTHHYDEQNSELLLSFIDRELTDIDMTGWQLNADVLCTNRHLPSQLAATPSQTTITFAKTRDETIAGITLLTAFTPTRRPFLLKGACWRYLSHLSPNPLTLADNDAAAQALRAILRIYQFDEATLDSPLSRSILNVQCQKQFIRHPTANEGHAKPFWHGLDIHLQLDTEQLGQHSLYLLGSILEHYFTLYVTPNFFTRLLLRNTAGEEYQGKALAGAGR